MQRAGLAAAQPPPQSATAPRLVAPARGILLYRGDVGRHEVLLADLGGPWWRRQEVGAWSIPKGECMADEEPYLAARREFVEELGVAAPDCDALPLGEIRQRAGKRVLAWALPGDLDASAIRSNTFNLEWPPHSVSFATSLRLTAPSGSRSKPPDRESIPHRGSCSIGSKRRCSSRAPASAQVLLRLPRIFRVGMA